jgi:hypothetical protein
MAVSFIGGGNWSKWRKPQPCRKSLTNLNNPSMESGSYLFLTKTTLKLVNHGNDN